MKPKCAVCANPISKERVIVAESRGAVPTYCSERCKNTAAVRRARARKRG